MNFMEKFKGIVRGEFRIEAKDKSGKTVYAYEDRNVVVDDARPTTAYLLCQAILSSGGANRPEFDGDGFNKTTDFTNNLINPQNFQISFIKMGGGFPRKRSYCDSSETEIPLAPAELVSTGGAVRSSLFVNIPYGSTLVDDIPADWVVYGQSTIRQPYHTSSLLYPRKTDTDILDRDYAWAKRISNYTYSGTATSAGFRADFTTTMRFAEGNGPEFDCAGKRQGENVAYEYREAGLFVGSMPWQYSANPSDQAHVDNENLSARNENADLGDIFGASNLAGDIDSTLTKNLREYRFWDGDSQLIGSSYASPSNTPTWPKKSSFKKTWDSGISYRNQFRSIKNSSINTDMVGTNFEGHFMVARKTFPVITKSKDLEFTIRWSLVFG